MWGYVSEFGLGVWESGLLPNNIILLTVTLMRPPATWTLMDLHWKTAATCWYFWYNKRSVEFALSETAVGLVILTIYIVHAPNARRQEAGAWGRGWENISSVHRSALATWITLYSCSTWRRGVLALYNSNVKHIKVLQVLLRLDFLLRWHFRIHS